MKNRIYSVIIFVLGLISNFAIGQSSTTSSGGYYYVKDGVEYYATAPAPSASASQPDNSTYNSNPSTYTPIDYMHLTYTISAKETKEERKQREMASQNANAQQAMFGIDETAFQDYLNKDYEKAFELYKKNFKTLFARGYRTMGYLYEKGLGTSINYEEAAKCYQLSTQWDDEWGEVFYGVLLRDGLGIEKNPEEAAKWFTYSALQGNDYGKSCLESMLYYNRDIPVAAIALRRIKPTDTTGLHLLIWIFTYYKTIYSVDSAIAGYKHRAALGDTTSQFITGEIFENSNTGAQGRDSAKYWYTKASAQGCTWAAEGLKNVNRDTYYVTSYISYSGVYYYGLFKNGLLDGVGRMSTASQAWYGNWSEGKLIHGTFECPSGTYVGDWKDGKITGQGIWKFPDSSRYEGGVKNGQWFGEGVYTYNKGFKQYATYLNNKPMNCKYKIVFPNGQIAEEGTYIDSLKEGKATQYYEDGKVEQVITYTKGVLNGNLKGYYKNGILRVDCEYLNGILWNIATYNKPDGTSTGCSFKDGAGEVKWYYDDGQLYEDCNYKNGALDGAYKSYYENGKLWSDIIYQDGKLWNTIADNMPDGKPTGSNVKNGNGITMHQSPDGATIIAKITWANGVVIKQENYPAK